MIRESTHLFGLPGLVNVGRVAEGIYRGADPAADDWGFRSLADLGVKTVLNLSRERDGEEALSHGIMELYEPLDFFRNVEEARIRKLVLRLSDTNLYPIFVHCAQGCDRTGMVIACYRIESGWSNEDAVAEMWSFGFHFVWSHFLEFVQNYKPVGR
jgi:tyrosine-protein phosphatase SIW14